MEMSGGAIRPQIYNENTVIEFDSGGILNQDNIFSPSKPNLKINYAISAQSLAMTSACSKTV
jgi:hypothetical protein